MKHLFHASMDMQSVKLELIQWLTELNDITMLKTLQRLKEAEEGKLTQEQEKDLQDRLHRYEAGELTFTSWKEAKESIRQRGKDAV